MADQVNGFSEWLAVKAAPSLTPEPLLRQGLDWNHVDHVVRQVLVEVR